MPLLLHITPSLTVSRVVSLTVPTQMAPVGTNPFEEDEEEEVSVQMQTTVNHIIVNKEEIKTLVKRRIYVLSCRLLPALCTFILFLWVAVCVFLCLLYH